MKLGTLLLGTAAGLMVASAAQAADLPGEPVPAAVDYVKVCDTFGAGFFYIPGTETCLDIGGRVRFRVQYNDFEGPGGDTQTLRFRADARVDFDVRSSTEYGTLRAFTRIGDEYGEPFADPGANEDNDTAIAIKLAFIQLGYFTAGLQGDVANGDVLYGDNSAAYQTGDSDLVGMTVLADDLGGGFYAGVGVYSGRGGRDNVIWGDDENDDFADVMVQGAIGMAGQPWGGVDLSVAWNGKDDYQLPDGTVIGGSGDLWTIKATADLSLMEGLNARFVAAYLDQSGGRGPDISYTTLAGALSYGFSDAATVYTGVRWDIANEDDLDDIVRANIGVDYTIVEGLVGTAEVSYADVSDNDEWVGLLQLSRSW
jgi:hypothetical protein